MEISWHILLNILIQAIKIQMETLEIKLQKQNQPDLRWDRMINHNSEINWLERSIWAMKFVVSQVRSRKDNGMQIVNFPQNDRPDLSRRHSSSSIRNKRDVITDTNNSNDWIYLFFWRFYKNTSIIFDLMKLEVMYFQ